jgi:hypothetical protein
MFRNCCARILTTPTYLKKKKEAKAKKIKMELWSDDEGPSYVKVKSEKLDELQPDTSKSFH